MKDTLKVGDRARLEFKVPAEKTVPYLYPESVDFKAMPDVFATGFMVGLMEWCCLEVLKPHLDPGEGSLGVHINVSHSAATVPGQTVTVEAECTSVAGRRVGFKVTAHDGVETIGAGSHERMVVPWERFIGRVNEKAARAGVPPIESCSAGA
ncbi:thioesterase family protein [Hyphomicrobium sp.]|uniref:thioesterase family protein n=1 Tax=Hyphomicrobium sp. TaxID=82 RepID=UPI0025BCF086|nr:thioesterase family protein [Hyphomicrobium sp.]MCC7251051.1 thioesterase family protein [Hyphomicrobium sp.]